MRKKIICLLSSFCLFLSAMLLITACNPAAGEDKTGASSEALSETVSSEENITEEINTSETTTEENTSSPETAESNTEESESAAVATTIDLLVSGSAVAGQTAQFVTYIPDYTAYNSTVKCTDVQGMVASADYLYSVKEKSDLYAVITQYDPKTGSQRNMRYLDREGNETILRNLGHCNSMEIYTASDGQKYIFTANAVTPSTNAKAHCITCLKLDEEEGTLTLAGYIDMKKVNNSGKTVYQKTGGIQLVAQTDSELYFLAKNGMNFFWFKISVDHLAFEENDTIEVNCTKLFSINCRNALFLDANGEQYPVPNIETWTNQGYYYSESEELLYVPLYNGYVGDNANRENVIITFSVKDMFVPEKLDAVTTNQTETLYPTTLNLYFSSDTLSTLEVENCTFLENPEKSGDFRLYFNTNAAPINEGEGIWVMDYTVGSVTPQCIIDLYPIMYTVEYDYNVEGVAESDWLQSLTDSSFSMLTDTTHFVGIKTNLRMNNFIRSKYTFAGYQLYRHSDQTWLYTDGNWYMDGTAPDGLEKAVLEDSVPVDNLTEVNGDLITAYVQWAEK